jgi:hypothetical protein
MLQLSTWTMIIELRTGSSLALWVEKKESIKATPLDRLDIANKQTRHGQGSERNAE